MEENLNEIKCEHCGRWFTSPIYFGSAEAFFGSTLVNNRTNCPYPDCQKMTGCNKENMRFGERRKDGRITYIEGKDT